MKYYQNNASKKVGIDYSNPLTSKNEFVVFAASITNDVGESVKQVTLNKGGSCLIGTGLHMIADGYLVFTNPSHIALHQDRYFFGKDEELMLQIANPNSSKVTIDLGDEITSFVIVKNELEALKPQKVNTLKDLLG